MPVCFDRKFIFFHIPRCSGTYLDEYYKFNQGNPLYGVATRGDRTLTLPHLTYQDIRAEGLLAEEVLNTFFKFTIIRDPFPRMVSDYIWQKKHDLHGEFRHLSFPQYLQKAQRIMEERKYFEKIHYDHFRPMSEYIFCDGVRVVDEILLLERIEDELPRISGRIGLDRMPRVNSSNYDISDFRSSGNLDRVYKLYAHDKTLYEEQLVAQRPFPSCADAVLQC